MSETKINEKKLKKEFYKVHYNYYKFTRVGSLNSYTAILHSSETIVHCDTPELKDCLDYVEEELFSQGVAYKKTKTELLYCKLNFPVATDRKSVV